MIKHYRNVIEISQGCIHIDDESLWTRENDSPRLRLVDHDALIEAEFDPRVFYQVESPVIPKLNLLQRLRFFFRKSITLNELSEVNIQIAKPIAQQDGIKNLVFKRTFNNTISGKGFEFIGFYPVFFNEKTMLCYYSESDTID